ncbi:hypothetical protein pb186bvf_008958 [Paramecium bursaria]
MIILNLKFKVLQFNKQKIYKNYIQECSNNIFSFFLLSSPKEYWSLMILIFLINMMQYYRFSILNFILFIHFSEVNRLLTKIILFSPQFANYEEINVASPLNYYYFQILRFPHPMYQNQPESFIFSKRQIFKTSLSRFKKIYSGEISPQLDITERIPSQPSANLSQESNGKVLQMKVLIPNTEEYKLSINGALEDVHIRQELRIKSKKGLSTEWLINGLRIITLISRFIYQLKIKAECMKVKLINFNVFQYIDDYGSDYHIFKKQQIPVPNYKQKLYYQIEEYRDQFRSIYNFLGKNLFDKIIVLQPDSPVKIIWDLVVVFFIVLNIFYIPMNLSFNLDVSSSYGIQLFFETIPSYVFILEILLNFNTAFYYEGVIHQKRGQIFSFYIQKGSFWWDLLIVIPYVLAQFNIPYIQFVLLLRVTRVRSMIQGVEDLLNLKESWQAVLELAKLVYFIILVAHMCSCAWHLLGTVEYENYGDPNSWLVYYKFYNQDWSQRYIVSLYWSVITTLTIGYGDIVPQTNLERFFVILIALVICGVFGYAISTIGEILKNLQEREAYQKQQMKQVNQYIKEKQLNTQLSLRVRKYFEYQLDLQKYENGLQDQVLKRLNEDLKSEVLFDIYLKVLLKSQIIKKYFKSEQFIQKLCQKVKTENFIPGDYIIKIGDFSDKLYFILEGELVSYSKSIDIQGAKEQKQLKKYVKGGVLGEQEFITSQPHIQSFRAQTFTQMAYIQRDDFIDLLKINQEEYLKFCEIKEKLLYSNSIGKICEICGWTHNYVECPFVFYIPNKWKLVKYLSNNYEQERKQIKRKINVKFKTRSNRFDYIEPCINYMLQNIITDDQINEKFLIKLGWNFDQSLKDTIFKKTHTIQSQTGESQGDQNSNRKRSSSNSQQLNKLNKNQQNVFLKVPFLQGQLKSNLPLEDNFSVNDLSGNSARWFEFTNPQDSILQNPEQNLQQQNPAEKQTLGTKKDSDHLLDKSIDGEKLSSKFKQFEIDKMQSHAFQSYFPHFNIQNVIEKVNRKKGPQIDLLKKRVLYQKIKNSRIFSKSQNSFINLNNSNV